MEMLVLLLVSLVAQLVSPAAAHPTRNTLNHVIDAAENYTKFLQRDYFVEDVTELPCNDSFYCKVHKILNHHHKTEDHECSRVLRTLQVYINSEKISCDEALKTVTNSDKSKPLPDLLEKLQKCSRHTNFSGSQKKGSS